MGSFSRWTADDEHADAAAAVSSRGPLEDWAADRMFTYVDLHLGWRDRLRMLAQGVVHLEVVHSVEHQPGRILTWPTTMRFDRIRWPWTKTVVGGYAISSEPSPR